MLGVFKNVNESKFKILPSASTNPNSSSLSFLFFSSLLSGLTPSLIRAKPSCIIFLASLKKFNLSDTSTYQRLIPEGVEYAMNELEDQLYDFVHVHRKNLTDEDIIFLKRSFTVQDKWFYFYIIIKVHKTPWSTRPIVSYCGSIAHGLS